MGPFVPYLAFHTTHGLRVRLQAWRINILVAVQAHAYIVHIKRLLWFAIGTLCQRMLARHFLNSLGIVGKVHL